MDASVQDKLLPDIFRVDSLTIEKTAVPSAAAPCAFTLTLSVEGAEDTAVVPLYLVFVVDATSSMGTMDMNNNTATRFQVAVEAIDSYLDILFSPVYASLEKHIALVTFGNGARVHVTQADAMGIFSGLVNPNPSNLSPGGPTLVNDHYIGANAYDPAQAQTSLNNFNSVADKTTFFYEDEADIDTMIDNISRYSNTNAQSGLLLAHELLNGVPANTRKVIIFITDGESAASSNFYAYYNEAGAAAAINAAMLVQVDSQLYAQYNSIMAPVTDEDLIREGIDPNNYDPSTFTPLQVVSLKLRALSRSTDFYNELVAPLVINPFAGEWHNFDTINAGTATRVPAVPNLLDPTTLNGYYWSNGRIGFAANYYYYERSPFFAKVDGIWQYSQSATGVPLEPVYTDVFFPQSIIGQNLDTVTFDNSPTELMIFATDQKIPQTRMIDYYEQTSRNIYASNQAKLWMIDAAVNARADGIVINTVGIGHGVLLPEYLDKTASSGFAYLVPADIFDSQDALRDQLLSFTEGVLQAVNNVLITDSIPRRDPSIECANDGTFTLDLTSIQIAYIHTPASPVVFQPVDLGTSTVVSVDTQTDRYVLTFLAGVLWSAEQAALEPDRFYKAVITFTIIANLGVDSANSSGIPDISTNLEAFVNWTDAEGVKQQDFPAPLVYVSCPCDPCQVVNDLIESIALGEAALAHILNAEAEKLQAVIAMEGITPEQLICFNKSVQRVVNSITHLEMIYYSKLALVRDMCDDSDPDCS